jgi:hypothetical protein
VGDWGADIKVKIDKNKVKWGIWGIWSLGSKNP